LKERITEVTVISNFITNIIGFSESANFFDSNFTVNGVILRKWLFILNIFYLCDNKIIRKSNNRVK
jgi:hypothetical protein